MKIRSLAILLSLLFASCGSKGQNEEISSKENTTMYKFEKSENEWKQDLSPQEYKILRQCGTEAPGTGKYYNFFERGVYLCAACGFELFDSKTKYSSGSGWPSFYDIIADSNVVLIEDNSLGMVRTEVRCANCGGHLGHVFTGEGFTPKNTRHCVNSISIDFIPENNKTDSKK